MGISASDARKQAESDLRQAKILTDISSQLSHGFRDINKSIISFAKAMGVAQKQLEGKRTDAAKLAKHDKDQLRQARETAANLQKLSAVKHAAVLDEIREKRIDKDARNRNRLDEIRTQGENVRFNLKMRQLYKDQTESFSSVMKMMGGTTVKGLAFGGLEKGFNTLRLGSEILETSKNLKEATAEAEAFEGGSGDVWEGEMKKLTDRVDRLTEVLKEQREKLGVFGKWGGEGEEDSKWAKRLEPIIKFAKKNRNGIIISAASIGLMFMVFKKLLSVSPMLQKMLEVMGLAFNLILRPFGDFLGFILRPIAMGFLTMVMPLFQKSYPLLMKLGTTIGDALSNWKFGDAIKAVLDTFPPMMLITAIAEKLGIVQDGTLTPEEMDTANVGLTGGALIAASGATLPASYASYRATKFGFNKLFGKTPSGASAAFSGLGGGGNPSDGNTGGKDPNWRDYKGVEKVSKMARMMSILSKIARIANPVGLALLGWGGITSVIKHVDPDLYQTMRDSTEFMGVGREFLGLGEQSDAEQLVGGYNWVKDSLGINNSILDNSASISNNGSNFNGIATPTANGGTNITFNIDKVEKGVDINMIAMAVKSVLETSNTRIVSI